MRLITICLLTTWLTTACSVNVEPFGMTERTQIRADAAVKVAQAEAAGKIGVEQERQTGINQRTTTIMLVVPFVVLLILAAWLIRSIIEWRGKLELERLRLSGGEQRPQLPRDVRQQLAARQCRPEWHGDNLYAVYMPTGQRLPEPITRYLEAK